MNPLGSVTDKLNDLSRWWVGALGITALVIAFVVSRVGLLGPLLAVIWIPFVGVVTMWILFDSREQGFKYPSVIALTVAILLLLVVPGIAALATYYYKTRLQH